MVLSTHEFRAKFNVSSFAFGHSLSGSDLFSIDRIRKLVRTVVSARGPRSVTCLSGEKGVDARWDEWDTPNSAAEKCLDPIDQPGSWVLVKELDADPDYAAVFEGVLRDISDAIGPDSANQITWPSAYLFVSSPRFITPLHIDHEVGLLLQIHGSKSVHLFDHADEAVVSQPELEAYYMGDLASVRYRSELESHSRVFHLAPGDGVCFPIHDPHWVQTDSEYSVSLSVNVCLRPFDRRAQVYQANHYLRKLGFNPKPPGRSGLRDELKRLPLSILSARHPVSKGEMLRSGVHRVSSLLTHLRQGGGVSSPLRRSN